MASSKTTSVWITSTISVRPRRASPSRAGPVLTARAYRRYVVWVEDVTEEEFPDTLAEMKYFDKRR